MKMDHRYYDNKVIGTSSLVLEMMVYGVVCPINETVYDAHVHITVLPTDVLADLNDLENTIAGYTDCECTIEQLASFIHRDVKAAYTSGAGYSGKSEVIVSVDREPMKVRVHVAG
jgi:hypothetical protein